ncbi:MAG: molybdate transport system ATP-binding protein, partial [Candidatus Azotimanducaceae bacterium]
HQILPYIDKLHSRLDFPFLYVSHGMDEIAYLTDKIHVIEEGRLTQSGSTLEISPMLTVNNSDSCAIVRCSVESYDSDYKLTKLNFENQSIYIAEKRTEKSNIKLNIPAKDVSITLEPQTASSILNIIYGTIASTHSSEDGSSILVQIEVGDQYLLSRITRRSMEKLNIKIGQKIYAQIKSVSLVSEYAD